MSDQNAKQQIVDKLKDVETVLVTVSTNPSVDELSAALGFTLLINKLKKHGTAVFSGDIPPAITFLDPEKTFENTVDSLRDFIIALDKEKADHLRYKVDGDMVKIFITPYKTVISQDDFDFSQGDYNVEMVIAIGVKSEDDLDRALAEHGRILHDATVAALSIGSETSELGTINWHEDDASSYSEMLVSVAESLRNDKTLIDEQIATAFLTGIVAATERFSNPKTTSKVMTMAAQLMAAGANQQLIATKLEEANEIEGVAEVKEAPKEKKQDKPSKSTDEPVKDKPAADGTMTISHEKKGDVDEVAKQVAQERQEEARKSAEELLAEGLAKTQAKTDVPSVEDLQEDLKKASDEPVLPAPVAQSVQVPDTSNDEPSLGGTLNATTEQAADDKRRQLEEDRNKTILSHDSGRYLAETPATGAPLNSYDQPANMADPTASQEPVKEFSAHAKDIAPLSPVVPPVSGPTLAELDAQNRTTHDDARSAIEAALQEAPAQQASSAPMGLDTPQQPIQPASMAPPMPGGLPPMPPMPPMPDFSQVPAGMPALPPMPGMPGAPQATTMPDPNAPQQMGQPAPMAPPMQPIPTQQGSFTPQQQEDFLVDRLGDILPPAQPVPAAPQTPADPSQFRIPGQ